MSRASGTFGSKPGVPGGTIRALGCWCPVGTVKHRPRRQPRPAATAAPVPTVSARPRRRRVKVFSQVFFKKLVGFGVKPQDLTGVRGSWCPVGTVQDRPRRQPSPATAFPYSKKRGDVRPQNLLRMVRQARPNPQGLPGISKRKGLRENFSFPAQYIRFDQ